MNTVAMRAREYRQRQKNGLACFQVVTSEIDLVAALQRRGFLQTADADDREKISQALTELVELWVAVDLLEDAGQ